MCITRALLQLCICQARAFCLFSHYNCYIVAVVVIVWFALSSLTAMWHPVPLFPSSTTLLCFYLFALKHFSILSYHPIKSCKSTQQNISNSHSTFKPTIFTRTTFVYTINMCMQVYYYKRQHNITTRHDTTQTPTLASHFIYSPSSQKQLTHFVLFDHIVFFFVNVSTILTNPTTATHHLTISNSYHMQLMRIIIIAYYYMSKVVCLYYIDMYVCMYCYCRCRYYCWCCVCGKQTYLCILFFISAFYLHFVCFARNAPTVYDTRVCESERWGDKRGKL